MEFHPNQKDFQETHNHSNIVMGIPSPKFYFNHKKK